MTRLASNIEVFVQYGISSDLAGRAAALGLTVTKVRALSLDNLQTQFACTPNEAQTLKNAVLRAPIDRETLEFLLNRSNYVCNVCKGTKSSAFIVHHIKPYAESQDNEYGNLIVLCPNDHDLAHRAGGLTMSISPEELHKLKEKWEAQVERANAAKAAQSLEVNDGAIDYINVRRIEELCLQLYGSIPQTRATASLTSKRIIDQYGNFQQEYVRRRLSGGKYLFDYINSGEALHYRDLMASIAEKITFRDLSEAVEQGKTQVIAMEGQYAYFIGGVFSKRPEIPITKVTPEVIMHYTKRKIRIEWTLDPNFFFSMSAIIRQGSKNRYIIYCLVRAVDTISFPGQTLVKASPFLIAQPSKYVDKTPAIHWADQYSDLDSEDQAALVSDETENHVPDD